MQRNNQPLLFFFFFALRPSSGQGRSLWLSGFWGLHCSQPYTAAGEYHG